MRRQQETPAFEPTLPSGHLRLQALQAFGDGIGVFAGLLQPRGGHVFVQGQGQARPGAGLVLPAGDLQAQAIDAVRENPEGFDLLMTDYNMPGMSGLDVAKAVLALSPALPVAVASGYITDELQSQALAAGVREVVFKTDAVEAFCEVVARLVAAPK